MKQIMIIGFVGKDPEEKSTQKGSKGYFFPVAVESFSKGEKKTIWYQIQVWDVGLFNMAKAIKKGSLIVVSGTLGETSIYQAKDGENRVNLSIKAMSLTFVPGKKSDADPQSVKQDDADISGMF
jgi:single-stranded DNA-binding protein